MVTVDMKQVSRFMLLEAYAEKHTAEEKIKIFKKRYNLTLPEIETQLYKSNEEHFAHFDDYMEWKAYEKYLVEINQRIQELQSGYIQVA